MSHRNATRFLAALAALLLLLGAGVPVLAHVAVQDLGPGGQAARADTSVAWRLYLPLILNETPPTPPTPTDTPTATRTPTPTNTPTSTNTPTPTGTPTPTDTPTPTGTPTATNTPTPSPTPPACYQAFANGGFETDTGWEIRPNPVLAAYVDVPVHAGSRSMRTGIPWGGANVRSYSPIQQAVTFPAALSALPPGYAKLSFWHYNVYGDEVASAASLPSRAGLPRTMAELSDAIFDVDFFYVIGIYEDDTIDWLLVEQLDHHSFRNTVIDVRQFADHQVRFQFGTYNNGLGGISRTFVDDASLVICPAGATPTSTPTRTRTPTPTSTPTDTRTPTPTSTPTRTRTPTSTPTVSTTPAAPYLRQTLSLPVDVYPAGVAVKADGQKVYVAQQAGKVSKLAVIQALPALGSATTIALGTAETAPNGVARIGAAGRVAVALRDTSNAWVVDAETGVDVATIPANLWPAGVAVHDGYGYIANYGNDTITVFDPATLAATGTLYVGHEPSHFAVTPGEDLFASMHGNGEIVRLRNGLVAGHFYGITAPYGLAYEPATGRLYIANRGPAHTVTVLDGGSGAVVGTIPIGQEPYVIALNPLTGHLFVACGNRVKVYRTSTYALVADIAVPAGAEEGIAFDPVTQRVYVTSRTGHALSAIQDVADGPSATGIQQQPWWLRLFGG